jgi:HSP20 family molecular chaperone IbpA
MEVRLSKEGVYTMPALLPRLFGDVSDWFDVEFPIIPSRFGQLIRVEDILSDQEYSLRAELPGLDPDKDIQLTVTAGMLTIKAERREEERAAHRSEFRYGALYRVVRLPANADPEKIKAVYDKGILTVTVPLTAPKPTGRQVPVTTPTK